MGSRRIIWSQNCVKGGRRLTDKMKMHEPTVESQK